MKLLRSILTGMFIMMSVLNFAQDALFVSNKSMMSEIKHTSYSNIPLEHLKRRKLRSFNDTEDEFKKNIFAINVFEMAFINFSCSYERIFGSGEVGIKIPFSVGLGGKHYESDYNPNSYVNAYFLVNKIIGSGLEINYYPIGQKKHTFYLGLSTVIGSFYYYKYTYDSIPNLYGTYTYTTQYRKQFTGTHFGGMIHFGGYLGLTENLIMGTKMGFGYKREETIFVDYTHPKMQLDLNIALRF